VNVGNSKGKVKGTTMVDEGPDLVAVSR